MTSWGENPAISAKRMKFCGQKYCAQILVTYRPDFEKIWQEKKGFGMIPIIPELVTGGGAADHSPTIRIVRLKQYLFTELN